MTANGIDTSPVVRGVWLLENLLGTPPSPPPSDVEPLDPDIRGARTIREQLEKHRSSANCMSCHRGIDPIGFALETYDPIGRWRDVYGPGKRVDASGKLPGGQAFDGIEGFKQILSQRQDVFAKALVTRLLAYATGREMGPRDRAAIDRIVAGVAERGHRFRDLVVAVAMSDTFRSK